MIGLFCRIQSLLQGSFAKETHNYKEPTNRSHPISSLSFYIVTMHHCSTLLGWLRQAYETNGVYRVSEFLPCHSSSLLDTILAPQKFGWDGRLKVLGVYRVLEFLPYHLFIITRYGVATISRLLKIIGLFCRISSLLYGSFAKEIYHFKEPTNRSHPISFWHPTGLAGMEDWKQVGHIWQCPMIPIPSIAALVCLCVYVCLCVCVKICVCV